VRVERTNAAPAGWDEYVAAHPRASAYHRSAAVGIGAAAFGLPVHFLYARGEHGGFAGVLPLVEQSSFLFGHFLVSVPFFTYGGVLADDDATAGELAKAAGELARERRVAHVELRHDAPATGFDLPARTDKVSMVLRLPCDEAALAKALGSKLRSQIKRAERENPEVLWGGAELVEEFYGVFAPAMHALGTPVYPKRFVAQSVAAFGSLGAVLVVRKEGRPHAAAIVVKHGRRVEVPWAAATPEAKRGALNMRMYWEMLRYAVTQGCEAFDFGRSTVDSGTYRFKQQWGAEPLQLYWHYWLQRQRELPKLNASNPKYARAAELWRRMPLWCANLLGPRIVRNLP
jgi:FemAB-related protein (PEP-CTERM system-associated)